MPHPPKNPPKKLEDRLVLIERLYDERKISEQMMDVLDALARMEAGLLSWQEAYREMVL